MRRFIEGEDRSHITLLPECLDDYIGLDNPVLSMHLWKNSSCKEQVAQSILQAHADRGYHNGRELKACEDAGIAAYVPGR